MENSTWHVDHRGLLTMSRHLTFDYMGETCRHANSGLRTLAIHNLKFRRDADADIYISPYHLPPYHLPPVSPSPRLHAGRC